MLHTKLYKLCSDGKNIQFWEIHTDVTEYHTETGKVDGKRIVGKPTACPPKVKRTQAEQLELQVSRKVADKLNGKYVRDIKDVKKADGGLPAYSAMLAKPHEKHEKKVVFPAMIQPKLDGVRCLSVADGFYSRNRKPFTSCSHIWEELEDFFKENPDARIDGEFYAHAWRDEFEKIVSAVRKTAEKATADDIKRQKKVKYHVYDAPIIGDLNDTATFRDRYAILKETFADYKNIVVVETHIIKDAAEIKKWHDHWVGKGFEGAIVRNMLSEYQGKRTADLLKVKEFMDEEYEITGVKEGKGMLVGHAATFNCVMANGTAFDAKLDGSHDRLKWIFNNPDSVIGKMATVRFFSFTNRGVPRFPVAKAVRGLKDRSDWV
tara:strand:- start:18194 stop:19324 length:1131 start_codon:yes stop_codon:yes gene_type:complete